MNMPMSTNLIFPCLAGRSHYIRAASQSVDEGQTEKPFRIQRKVEILF